MGMDLVGNLRAEYWIARGLPIAGQSAPNRVVVDMLATEKQEFGTGVMLKRDVRFQAVAAGVAHPGQWPWE